jgi:hypothetical protein
MKRPATCIAGLLILAAPSALAETKTYPAQPFSQIEAGGPIDAIYEPAATPAIVVEQAENDFSDVYLEFEGDTLVVSRNSVRNRSGWFNRVSINTKNNRKIIKVNGKRVPYYIVRVSGPNLDAVTVKSSAKLTANGVDSDSFEARASSSGDLEISGSAEAAKLHASSSGDILATAFHAETLDIHTSSSGDIEATSSGTGLVQIDATSSGGLELNSLAAAEFLIKASSSADLELAGRCASIKVEASSSADVDAIDLTCRAADVTASSSADVSVTATESITAQASSSGDIFISGSPAERDITRSSGGDVEFGGWSEGQEP